jgi:N-acetylmuramoyl-L-alanine amidase
MSGIIVIDPGHCGIDGVTNKDGILEKEINLDIVKILHITHVISIQEYRDSIN